MARTVRTYWDNEGVLVKDHRDGRTGWVCSPRRDERDAKRTERREAIRAAWAEARDEG